MSSLLADRIVHHLTPPGYFPGPGPATALLAVVDRCEQMRRESANTPGGVGHFFADEFESVIARALGIEQ